MTGAWPSVRVYFQKPKFIFLLFENMNKKLKSFNNFTTFAFPRTNFNFNLKYFSFNHNCQVTKKYYKGTQN